MGLKIGIDFGTTNTLISYMDGNEVKAFEYPAQQGSIFIPSIIHYDEQSKEYEIGMTAMMQDNYVSAMKMFLPMSEEEKKEHGWNSEFTPEELVTEFFKRILKYGFPDSFEERVGKIDEIIVCVPEVWNREVNHKGREKIREVFNNIGLKVKRIVSEPVAAAAYFKHFHKKTAKREFVGNLLVCDMGGGTFDVTFCKINHDGKIEVIQNAGNGTTRDGKGKAGVFFDETLIKNHHLRTTGQEINIDSPEYKDIYCRLQDVKFRTQLSKIQSVCELGKDQNEEDNKGLIVYKQGKMLISYYDVHKSFKEISSALKEVLEKIRNSADDINAFFLTGGFNQFYLCQNEIMQFFGNKEGFWTANLDGSIAGKSISYGACYVCNNQVSIDEKYSHNIGFVAYNRGNPIYQKIIICGKSLDSYSKYDYFPAWLKKYGNKPLSFEMFIEFDGNDKQRLIRRFENVKLPNDTLLDNQWQVGLKLDDNQMIWVAFKDKQGEILEYPLESVLNLEGKLIL